MELVEHLDDMDELNTPNYEPCFEIVSDDNMDDILEFYIKRFEEYLDINSQLLGVIGRNESSLYYFFKCVTQILMVFSVKQ